MASRERLQLQSFMVNLGDGHRFRIRLGRVTRRDCNTFRQNVEALVSNRITSRPPEPYLAKWLSSLPPRHLAMLQKHGLAGGVGALNVTLESFLEDYFANLAVKPGTRLIYGHTRRKLLDFFPKGQLLRAITPLQGDQFRTYLSQLKDKQKLSASTINRRVGLARQFLHKAVKRKLLADNPFADVRAGQQVNTVRQFFLTREDADKVLAACPNPEWQLLFGLARFAGLRIPSESSLLTWDDVEWDKGRFRVRSPKTEHHQGGEMRWVPIFPELHPYLLQAYQRRNDGSNFVLPTRCGSNANLRTQFCRILRKAGLKPWPKLFQNLRSTCQTELQEKYGPAKACRWIGNSLRVAEKHYIQATEDEFLLAAGITAKAAQNPAQNGSELIRIEPQTVFHKQTKNPGNSGVFLIIPPSAENVGWARQDSNL